MAKITDPDFLVRNTEIVFDFTNSSARTIQLTISGNLSTDGVTLQAIYSKCKELWKSASDLIKIPFPFDPITPTQFDLVNNWNFADSTTRQLIRDAGWSVRDGSGAALEEWAGIISLGTVGNSDQIYYQQVDGGASQDFVRLGAANQAIQIFKSGAGAFNYRSYLKLFCRVQGKTYAQATLTDIGVTAMTYQTYAFPISNAQDLKITANDATIAANAPYTGMSITYQASPVSRAIGGSSYNFSIVVNGNNATAEQIYEFVQYKLRQNSDIDAGTGTVTGKTANSLLRFLGDTLITSTGVYIDAFSATDTNRIQFFDNTGTQRTFPYVAAGTIIFNDNLRTDPNAVYRLFFASGYGTASAITVNDNTGTPIAGNISGAASISFSFDYDGNTQGGRTPGTDAPVVAVALGLAKAQYAQDPNAVITRSTTNVVSLVSSLERNFANN